MDVDRASLWKIPTVPCDLLLLRTEIDLELLSSPKGSSVFVIIRAKLARDE
jgi:hypothetical protein